MEYIHGLKNFKMNRPSAVMIGKFDGFHLGHQRLLRKLQTLAQSEGIASIVIAFDMVPLLKEKGLLTGVLMERSEKRVYLQDKVDYFVDCPFDASVSEMQAERFIRDELAEKLCVRHVVVGADFRFGKDRRGDVQMLEHYQESYGYELHIVPDVYRGYEKISSHLVKDDLVAGRFQEVNSQLGHPWQIFGRVNHGRALGKNTFGMATINITPDPVKALPPYGVYVVGVEIKDPYDISRMQEGAAGRMIPGVANLGIKPTVGGQKTPDVEVHLIDFDQEIYGEQVVVSFYEFLRPEKKFDSYQALKEQMQRDLSAARAAWRDMTYTD